MRRSLFAAAIVMLAALGAVPGIAQSPTAAAKADAKDFARSLIPRVAATAKTPPTADTLPGFVPGTPAASRYYSDPEALAPAGQAQAPANPGYSAIRQSMDSRARFDPVDLENTIERGLAVSADPGTYVSGFSASGAQGVCRALPAPTGSPGTYEQSCNSGFALGDPVTRSCAITLNHRFSSHYRYQCGQSMVTERSCTFDGRIEVCSWVPVDGLDGCTGFEAAGCTKTATTITLDKTVSSRAGITRLVNSDLAYLCPAPTLSPTPAPISVPPIGPLGVAPATLLGIDNVYLDSSRDESQCAGLPGDGTCEAPLETCVDASPETRIINGLAITQSCWSWTRSWQCTALAPANDCGALESLGCTYLREECLTDEQPCLTFDRVYSCPIPAAPAGGAQYICDGDVYCINGECETIERTPNAEFGQAAVALNSAAQAGKELDPDSLTVFRGTRLTCGKAIFGITNCCAPRGLPLIGGCDKADQLLKDKREQGLCHYVGSYCSSKTLGVCTKKREAYCCYESKLSRILQEQGRPQLGLNWASPKKEQCAGFTVDQFARLDLSKMDFSEVMAEFVDAARLPDELATATAMQERINQYFEARQIP
jgi:conjugal transfer mating pair stabilization protein TraN